MVLDGNNTVKNRLMGNMFSKAVLLRLRCCNPATNSKNVCCCGHTTTDGDNSTNKNTAKQETLMLLLLLLLLPLLQVLTL